MLCVRYEPLIIGMHIHKKQTHRLVKENVRQGLQHKEYSCKEKQLCYWASRGLAPNELIGGKPPVLKYLK
jgi:hypothetical protein